MLYQTSPHSSGTLFTIEVGSKMEGGEETH